MNSTSDLLNLEILPLSRVKATLSEQVNKVHASRKRVAITTNGFPRAVLISYEDFIDLLGKKSEPPVPRIDYADWKRGEPGRLKARDSILGLFDMKRLSRKGQKAYKKDLVDEFDRKLKSRSKKSGR